MLKKVTLVFLILIIFKFSPEFSGVNDLSAFSSLNSDSVLNNGSRSSSVVILGDIQKTSFWEYFLGRESNDDERVKLINEITNVNPAALILLGDMVFDGSSESNWRSFDSLILPVMKKEIPLLPVLGNHEYWGSNSSAKNNFKNRFPQFIERHWYSRVYNNLGFIFLDSNQDDLTPDEKEEQKEWFSNTLNAYEDDENIKGILVFLHHPPYTNSSVTWDELHVQESFLTSFNQSKKTVAMITGHAHTYERFFKEGKTFIVSGGGGGPRVSLRNSEDCHTDLCTAPSPRPFHFLLLDQTESGVLFTVKALDKGSSDFYDLEKFYISFNN